MQADDTPSAAPCFTSSGGGAVLDMPGDLPRRQRFLLNSSTAPDQAAHKAPRGSSVDDSRYHHGPSTVESNSCTEANDAKEKEARKTQTQTGAVADIPSSSPGSPPSPRATAFAPFRSTGPSAGSKSQAKRERSQSCRGVLTSLIRVLSSSVAFLVVVIVSTPSLSLSWHFSFKSDRSKYIYSLEVPAFAYAPWTAPIGKLQLGCT